MSHKIAIIFSLSIALCAAVTGFSQVAADGQETVQIYYVRSGDNLYNIAKVFHTTIADLQEVNRLKNDRLSIGQALRVPAQKSQNTSARRTQNSAVAAVPTEKKAKNEQIYAVRSRDSLFSIARNFNTTVETLKRTNGLADDRLSIGQILRVPAPPGATVGDRSLALQPSEAAAADPAQNAEIQPPSQDEHIGDEEPTQNQLAEFLNQQPALTAKSANMENSDDAGLLPLQKNIIEAGFTMLGIRYRFGGTSEKTGMDCSALVRNLFARFDIQLPRSSREQYQQGEKVKREDLRVGDLVFFSATKGKVPTHVGVYIGNNQFLHAASKAKKVLISNLSSNWYDIRYIGARRILDLWWEDEILEESQER